MRTEDIARVCHEANRAYCCVLGEYQPAWDDAPKYMRDSTISGVLFNLNHPGVSARDAHEEWMRYMKLNGWKYGEEKKSEIKEHPCLVPYEDLPEEQRKKDAIFIAVIHALEPQSFRINSSIEIPVVSEAH